MKALGGTCRSFALVTLREAAQGGAMEHGHHGGERVMKMRPRRHSRVPGAIA